MLHPYSPKKEFIDTGSHWSVYQEEVGYLLSTGGKSTDMSKNIGCLKDRIWCLTAWCKRLARKEVDKPLA